MYSISKMHLKNRKSELFLRKVENVLDSKLGPDMEKIYKKKMRQKISSSIYLINNIYMHEMKSGVSKTGNKLK